MIKKIIGIFKSIIRNTQLGFYYICLLLAKGFFFYLYIIVSIFEKIFKLKIFKNLKNFFKNRQSDPVAFLMLVLFFLVGVFLYTYLYNDEEIKYVDDTILEETTEVSEKPKSIESDKETYSDNEINIFRKYAKMNINDVDFNELKNTNNEVVAWIMVDGTNINYPIVQGGDNDYYLNHDILKNPKASGWPFMDYRNNNMSNDNTIFYGHNLLNKTAFGSISNVFTNSWFKNSNHLIIVRTPDAKYVYEVFACYFIDPEVYYLQEDFYNDNERLAFYNKLKSRSRFNFNIELTANDKIITLSTCTDDNKGRKVIHARLKK